MKKRNKKISRKPDFKLIIFFGLLMAAIIYCIFAFGGKRIENPYSAKYNGYPTSPTPTTDPAKIKLLTFKSKTTGFSLQYPSNWEVSNRSSLNCGNAEVNGTRCRDSYTFYAPNGISIQYFVGFIGDQSPDKTSCGTQSVCDTTDVLDLETINIPGIGETFLVKTKTGIALHKPLSNDTIPEIGATLHNYLINFNIPSNGEGRFLVSLRVPSGDFDQPTAKKGIEILKSVRVD